jgi:hypothetical protein
LRSWIKNSCLVILGLIGLKTTDANAAVDMVLCINGVAGSTTDTKNDTGCIDVLAWSWGVSNSTIAKGQGGKASFSGISITKSPLISNRAARMPLRWDTPASAAR